MTAQNLMDLPLGATCGDCVHLPRCSGLYAAIPESITCDFYPVRFKAKTKEVIKTDTHDVEFTFSGGRYSTDADTYRILFEAKDGPFEAPIILAGLQNKKIKEVIRDGNANTINTGI